MGSSSATLLGINPGAAAALDFRDHDPGSRFGVSRVCELTLALLATAAAADPRPCGGEEVRRWGGLGALLPRRLALFTLGSRLPKVAREHAVAMLIPVCLSGVTRLLAFAGQAVAPETEGRYALLSGSDCHKLVSHAGVASWSGELLMVRRKVLPVNWFFVNIVSGLLCVGIGCCG